MKTFLQLVSLANLTISAMILIGLGYFFYYNKRRLDLIMKTQEEFNEQMSSANLALDKISTSIAEEKQQITDFITANPSVDTSALDGVVERLGSVADSVSGIFEETPVEQPIGEATGTTEGPADEVPIDPAGEVGTSEVVGDEGEGDGV